VFLLFKVSDNDNEILLYTGNEIYCLTYLTCNRLT